MPHLDVTPQLPMVRATARRLAARLPPRVDLDDLVAAGNLGLVEAAARFDPSRGVGFTEFARVRVQGAMLDALRSRAASSRGTRRLRRELDETRCTLAHRLGRAPEDQEVAAAMGIPVDELERRERAAVPMRVVSLEDLGVGDDVQSRLVKALASREVDPDERIALAEAVERVAAAVETLPGRQRLVLSLYYVEDLRLREIGEMLGVTESRVCQLHTAALRALRALLETEEG